MSPRGWRIWRVGALALLAFDVVLLAAAGAWGGVKGWPKFIEFVIVGVAVVCLSVQLALNWHKAAG